MASLAEQLRSLSTPAPSRFDLDEDEFDVTRAQAIDKGDEYGGIESETVSATSNLRKKTAPLLHDVDKKYAGRKITRAQIEASRSHHVDDSDGEEEGTLEGDFEGSISGLGMSEDEDDNDKDVDGNENQEGTVKTCINGASNSNYDDDDDDDYDDDDDDSSSGDDNDDDGSDNEKDSVHSASDDKSEENYSSATEDDFDPSGNEDDDDNDDEDLGDGAIQSFSTTSLKEDLEKGKAAKNQLSLWDSFLEMRIRLQKALVIANRLPQKDQLASFNSSGDKNLRESYKQGRKSVAKLLGNLLWIQEKLLEQNPDTRNILHPGAESSKSTAHSSDEDEEIPSDTEDEKSDDDDNDDDLEDTDDQPNGKQAESSLKLPAKRKHELATSEYAKYISKRHAAFKSYRDATVSKWSEKTRLASGKLNSKSFSSFDRSALAQINHILSDKARLIKRTQLKRTPYRVLGKLGDNEQKTEAKEEQSDLHLKDYDPEIFDDDDFYHQLLREFIEQRASGNTGNPIDMGRQWLELQKLRRKVKRKVDTKASKGRKIRYDIHGKLVSFMAPIDRGTMADSSRNELFCSLFGAKQQEQAADINVFR